MMAEIRVGVAHLGETLFTKDGMIRLHRRDLPDGLDLGPVVAIDTETMGLDHRRDRLCLVQLSSGDGNAHCVQIARPGPDGTYQESPNLRRLLEDTNTLKIFHFARFDLAALRRALGVTVAPVVCTKIASKLVRTYTDRHGLKDLCRDLVGVEISKQQQTSDWGAPELSQEQLAYAASDVLHLHALWARLKGLLEREGRLALAEDCFRFLPTRSQLDLMGYDDPDIFTH
jgi:ribonuclease D